MWFLPIFQSIELNLKTNAIIVYKKNIKFPSQYIEFSSINFYPKFYFKINQICKNSQDMLLQANIFFLFSKDNIKSSKNLIT